MAVNVVFAIVCLLGCLYQIVQLTVIYVGYYVNTEISLILPVSVQPPSTSMCYRYTDLVDITRFNKDKNTALNFNSKSITSINQLQSELTIAQIFSYTPSDNLIAKCFMRSNISYAMITYHKCQNIIAVKKYFVLEYVCYEFSIVDDRYFPAELSSRAFNFAHALYAIYFNSSVFDNALITKPVLHMPPYLPLIGITFAKVFKREPSRKSIWYYNFDLTPSVYESSRLPAPYTKPGCTDYLQYGFVSQFDCFSKCLQTKTLKAFEKVPFTGFLTENLP